MHEKEKRLLTPKKIYPLGRKMTTEDMGEARAFVERAGLGGVTAWVQSEPVSVPSFVVLANFSPSQINYICNARMSNMSSQGKKQSPGGIQGSILT
jgi:hypothetical protein